MPPALPCWLAAESSLCLAVLPDLSGHLSSALTWLFCHKPATECPGAPPSLSNQIEMAGPFSPAPVVSWPHLSLSPNTRSASAKLICLRSRCLCHHTGRFSTHGLLPRPLLYSRLQNPDLNFGFVLRASHQGKSSALRPGPQSP